MKKVLTVLLTVFMCLGFSVTAMAETANDSGADAAVHPPYVVDKADLLTDEEESQLNRLLADISERQRFTVAVLTTNSMNGKTPAAFTDDYYDYNGYGYGAKKDGAMLMVSMEKRDWHISTTGYGITALTDEGIDYIGEKLIPYLSGGDYYNAFVTYGKFCDEFVAKAHSGSAYDVGNMPSGSAVSGASTVPPYVSRIFISLGIGAVLALIVCLIMKSKLKSVKSQPAADNYVRPDSFKLNVSRDIFLYTKTSRRPRPKANSGGSSTHTSSSGTSHGGGGGKF